MQLDDALVHGLDPFQRKVVSQVRTGPHTHAQPCSAGMSPPHTHTIKALRAHAHKRAQVASLRVVASGQPLGGTHLRSGPGTPRTAAALNAAAALREASLGAASPRHSVPAHQASVHLASPRGAVATNHHAPPPGSTHPGRTYSSFAAQRPLTPRAVALSPQSWARWHLHSPRPTSTPSTPRSTPPASRQCASSPRPASALGSHSSPSPRTASRGASTARRPMAEVLGGAQASAELGSRGSAPPPEVEQGGSADEHNEPQLRRTLSASHDAVAPDACAHQPEGAEAGARPGSADAPSCLDAALPLSARAAQVARLWQAGPGGLPWQRGSQQVSRTLAALVTPRAFTSHHHDSSPHHHSVVHMPQPLAEPPYLSHPVVRLPGGRTRRAVSAKVALQDRADKEEHWRRLRRQRRGQQEAAGVTQPAPATPPQHPQQAGQPLQGGPHPRPVPKLRLDLLTTAAQPEGAAAAAPGAQSALSGCSHREPPGARTASQSDPPPFSARPSFDQCVPEPFRCAGGAAAFMRSAHSAAQVAVASLASGRSPADVIQDVEEAAPPPTATIASTLGPWATSPPPPSSPTHHSGPPALTPRLSSRASVPAASSKVDRGSFLSPRSDLFSPRVQPETPSQLARIVETVDRQREQAQHSLVGQALLLA